jgi:hypothetical protein
MWLTLIAVTAFGELTSGTGYPLSRHAVLFPRLTSDIVMQPFPASLALDGEWIPRRDEATENLRWLRDHNRGSRVVVRVLSGATWGEVRATVAIARDAGVTRLTFLTSRDTLFIAPHAWRFDRTKLVTRPEDDGDFELTTTYF